MQAFTMGAGIHVSRLGLSRFGEGQLGCNRLCSSPDLRYPRLERKLFDAFRTYCSAPNAQVHWLNLSVSSGYSSALALREPQ